MKGACFKIFQFWWVFLFLTAMGTRKKCEGNFIFTSTVAKVRYDGITTAKISSKICFCGSVSTMKRCIINNSKKQALNILLTKCSSLQIFIKSYLKTLSKFIICTKIEVQTSLVEKLSIVLRSKAVPYLFMCSLHICLFANVPDE